VGIPKENQMRAILCGCNRRLQADNYEGLVEEVLEHLLQGHSGIRLGDSQVRAVREIVAARSYRLEQAEYE
jgi:hypothetical protein